MYYLTVDGMISGTGIRDTYRGDYLDAEELGISAELAKQIAAWLSKYRSAHSRDYKDPDEVRVL